MNDGAHQGVSAQRALETILGGKEAPKEEEQATREQVLARILAAPGPLGDVQPEEYGQAADCITKAFWLVHQEAPEAPLTDDVLWNLVKKKWPGFNDWVRGASGFQVGWALNCVRWLAEQPPAPNPAIIEVNGVLGGKIGGM